MNQPRTSHVAGDITNWVNAGMPSNPVSPGLGSINMDEFVKDLNARYDYVYRDMPKVYLFSWENLCRALEKRGLYSWDNANAMIKPLGDMNYCWDTGH